MVTGVLYIVASAAPPVERISALVAAARRRGWDACLILTPTAARWLAAESGDLAAATGHPVRSAYKMPGEPDVLPPADAMLVVPATFNTINKWSAGISDTLALGLINEAIGMPVPVVAVPWVSGPLALHPALTASLATLRAAGVTVLDLHPRPSPGEIPWEQLLDALGR
jgi:phosphopantothenoylcysteine synthetase/decarboxylase